MHPTIKVHDNLCFPLWRAYLLLLSPTLHKSHGDLHPSFLHFILWQAQYVGKILVYMANWMWVFMNYYCWHYPWGKTLGGKTISPYLSQLLTLTQYLWVWSFNRTQRKIGAYSVASQPFTSRVMSTIITPATHIQLNICAYIFLTTWCLPKEKK